MGEKSIFRQESLDRVSSPEQLNDYIRVSTPSVWLILGAFFILAVSVIVWGVTGTLPKTTSLNGVAGKGHTVVCYIGVGSVESDLSGCKATVTPLNAGAAGTPIHGTVVDVSKTPYSDEEIKNTLKSGWIESNLVKSRYSYAVTIRLAEGSAQLPADTLARVSVITAELKPIRFLLN